jgi:hypothetical protein
LIVLALCIAVAGQTALTVAQPPTTQPAALQSDLRRSIASMTSLDPKHIEIRATETVVTVRLVNTLYDTGPASDREYLASTIAALISKDSKDNPSLAMVIALHVEFIKRGSVFTKTLDTVEYRRDQTGALTRHKT